MALDARVRYTRRVIQETFLELLREMPLNRVTVKELCQRAELNRATFYRHFADPYDLMDKIEDELLAQLEEYVEQSIADGFPKAMEGMLRQVVKSGGLYQLIASPHGDPGFSRRLSELCWRKLSGQIDAGFPALSAAQRRWLYEFLAQGCNGILQNWMAGGMAEPPEETAAFLAGLTKQVEFAARQLQIGGK